VRYGKFLEEKSVLLFLMFPRPWSEATTIGCRICYNIAGMYVPAPAREYKEFSGTYFPERI